MTKPLSKRQAVIAIMNEYKEGDMATVVSKIVEAQVGLDAAQAKAYYRWCVNQGHAPGKVEGRKAKEPTEKKVDEKKPEATGTPMTAAQAEAHMNPGKNRVIESFAHKYIRRGWRPGVKAPKDAPAKTLVEVVEKGIANGDVRVHKIPAGKGGEVKPKKAQKAA